jgi:ABC-type multidrug transport system permease subunit
LIIREYKGGLYHLGIWFIAKNLSELPMQILMPILFFVPAYLLIGIGISFKVYFYLQIAIMLANSCAVALGYMVSCLCRRVDIAPIVGVVIILPFMLFGGLFLNTADVPKYFIWIQYISPIKFGFEAVMKIFWKNVPSIPCGVEENCIARTGEQVLENYSMTDTSAFVDCVVLFALNIGFRLVALISLWFNIGKKK